MVHQQHYDAVTWQQAGPSPQTLPGGKAESLTAFSMGSQTLTGPAMVELVIYLGLHTRLLAVPLIINYNREFLLSALIYKSTHPCLISLNTICRTVVGVSNNSAHAFFIRSAMTGCVFGKNRCFIMHLAQSEDCLKMVHSDMRGKTIKYRSKNNIEICNRSNNNIQIQWVEIINDKCKNFMIANGYKAPDGKIGDFFEYLEIALQHVNLTKFGLFLTGDFHKDYLDTKSENTKKMKDLNNMDWTN